MNEPRIEDELLNGSFDLHAHGHPEFTSRRRPRLTNLEWAAAAEASGMRGFVMKSHVWPTTGIASMVRELHPGLDVFGSITLNPPVGGLSPTAVEMAVEMGARMVWMPTWSARHVPPRHSITLERMRPILSTLDVERVQGPDSLDILGPAGSLKPEVADILAVCAERKVAVASGHLPAEASLVLAGAAHDAGVTFVMTHACSGSVGATLDQQRTVAELGGYVEHVMIGSMPMHGRSDPRDLAAAMHEIGPEHCVMSSDAGEAWNPPAPEVLRMFIASMLDLGVGEDAVRLMTRDNPLAVLGLPTVVDDKLQCTEGM